MSYTLIQAQSNAFCQHATSNRECLPDDAGQIRHFFFNFDEIITLSKLIHQNVFFGGRLTPWSLILTTGTAEREDASAQPRPSQGSKKMTAIHIESKLVLFGIHSDECIVFRATWVRCLLTWVPRYFLILSDTWYWMIHVTWYLVLSTFLWSSSYCQVLPPEYGGSGSSVDELTKYWIEQVLKHINYYGLYISYVNANDYPAHALVPYPDISQLDSPVVGTKN